MISFEYHQGNFVASDINISKLKNFYNYDLDFSLLPLLKIVSF